MGATVIRPEEIRSAVRQHYGQIARDFNPQAGTTCCGPGGCDGGAEATVSNVDLLYLDPNVTELPTEVTGLSLGCGDPVTLASLRPGQAVLDLGSGGGIDCFLAAKQVGPEGHIIGVDMTADMIDRARANAARLGAANIEFRLGEIEHLPVADATVDMVISNCVINLSPDKPQVFREALRVLRPGGQLAVSDIVTRVPLPQEGKHNLGSWAACVSGAWVDRDYVAAIEAAGFVDVQIEAKVLDDDVITNGAEQLGLEINPSEVQNLLYSARVTARKPAR